MKIFITALLLLVSTTAQAHGAHPHIGDVALIGGLLVVGAALTIGVKTIKRTVLSRSKVDK